MELISVSQLKNKLRNAKLSKNSPYFNELFSSTIVHFNETFQR